ncbi:MAG: VOC family protein [Verrucomicrobiota bacterium]
MTKDIKIPANYQTVMPYLIVRGAAEFISFTEKVFGALQTHKTMRDERTIMHAEIMIGECTIMFADATPEFPERPAGMFVYVKDADETYKKAIAASASILTPLADQPYGRSGGVKDPFGNSWWITAVSK